MVVLQHRLSHSIPKFIAPGHLVGFLYALEVSITLFGPDGHHGNSLVVGDRINIAAVVEGQEVKIFVLDSSAGLREEGFGFVEVSQGNGWHVELHVHYSRIVVDESTYDVCNDLCSWHLLIVFCYC